MKTMTAIALVTLSLSSFASNPSEDAQAFFNFQTALPETIFTDPCGGDFNFDGIVNNPDALIMLSYFNTSTDQGCDEGDLDGDGLVTINDIRTFIPNWGYICD